MYNAVGEDFFSGTPYMSEPSGKWISYDDEASLGRKVDLAGERGFGGVSAWSLDLDDFKGRCGQGKYPLLRAINERLAEKRWETKQELNEE